MTPNDFDQQQHQRTRRPKKEDVQNRLMDAATRIFAQKGFEKATLEEIAESAGFSKGAVYSNYASKDELFFALMEKHIDERIARIAQAMSSLENIADRPQLTGDLLVSITRQERDWQILFMEYWLRAVRNPELRARFIERREPLRAQIAQVIAELGIALPLSPQNYALTMLALSNGLGVESLVDPHAVPDELFGNVLGLLFKSY